MVRKKKKNILKRILITILVVLIIIMAILFTICKTIYGGNIRKMVSNILTKFSTTPKTIYVLILGVSEGIDTELSDTIMLAGYNPETQNVFILSIPRDTFVGKDINFAKGTEKINSYYRRGIDNIKEKVENITNIDIDNYIVVKTSVLTGIIDKIGGIYFDVPIDMNYDDPTQNLHIHLKAGYQKLSGSEAEQLLRFRHNNDNTSYSYKYGDNDLGRMKTQREFIKQTLNQLISFKNVFKIKKLINYSLENLETDFTKQTIKEYIPYVIDINFENIMAETLPGTSSIHNGVWVYEYNKTKTNTLIENLLNSIQN